MTSRDREAEETKLDREDDGEERGVAKDFLLRSLTIAMDEDALESATEPVSLSCWSSFYRTIFLCGESLDARSTCAWVLRLGRRIIFALMIVPIPIYIGIVRKSVCRLPRPLLQEDVDDVIHKMLSLYVR